MSERAALWLSAGAAVILGLLGLTVAIASGSGAILLDGAFNLCFFATALLTLRVATLVARPDDERYPFGYLFFEPLINTVKGLLILGVSAIALFDAVVALASGGRAVHSAPPSPTPPPRPWPARWSSSPSAAPPRAPSSPPTSRTGPSTPSSRAASSSASSSPPPSFAPATPAPPPRRPGDGRPRRPRLARGPGRMAVRGVGALLTALPTPRSSPAWRRLARGALAPLPVARLWVRAIQPGRVTYVTVHVLLPPGDPARPRRGPIALRGRVIAAVAARHAPVVADVVFTATEAYAAPTSGYTS